METDMHTQHHQLFDKIQIGLASPNQIRDWAERFIPAPSGVEKVGEVSSWETVNYKTLKPEPGGLFCQKIFGPIHDFTCACGKKGSKESKLKEPVCPKCGVERTLSRVRRYRLGYIKLKQPVVHALYASQRPSPLALCMNWSTRRVQAVTLTTEFCHLPKTFTRFRSRFQISILFQKRTKSAHRRTKPENAVPNCQNVPRLFSTKKELKYPRFVFNMNSGEPRLYGFAYDATWRHVEEFQEILFYLWEQPFRFDSSLPYYAFTLPVENQNKESPKHPQFYGIQTGGFVFQQILSHVEPRKIQSELVFHDLRLNEAIRINLEKISQLDFRSFEDRKKYKRLRIKINRLQTMKLKCKRQRELFRDFDQTKMKAAWMTLSYLPVLPPGLRPITSIRGELVVSDINVLYRKVLIRNKRITEGAFFGIFDTVLSGSWLSWCYNIRQVQQAVDELLKTGSVESGRSLKSLLDTLKGKQGRFRQHLLGKRVDYSGRSVIVVGPQLKLHQCGLPKQMALELFQPFLIQRLRRKGIVVTTTAAKTLIAEKKPIVWSILSEILKTHPVLLNRAPTLHRLGIQAFLPQLVEGKAILLHPLVCPAFNADFDGDQMAVHVPLSPKTRAETLTLLWSRNHVLAPASGQPLLLPTQDMVLGFYYLTCSQEIFHQEKTQIFLKNEPIRIDIAAQTQTTKKPKQKFFGKASGPLISGHHALLQTQNIQKRKVLETVEKNNERVFSSFSRVKKAYDRGFLKLHSVVWVKWSSFVETFVSEQNAYSKETLMEMRVNFCGKTENVFLDTVLINNETPIRGSGAKFVRTTVGRILMHDWIFEKTSG